MSSKPEKMFNENYPFYTSSSEYMKSHFKNYAQFVRKYIRDDSKKIEIGSNDGTFLSNYSGSSNKILGVEPSKNVANLANENKIHTINNFFNVDTAKSLKDFLGKTDLICASNVICHVLT